MEEERGQKEKAMEGSKQEEEEENSGDDEEEEEDDCYLIDRKFCSRKLTISDSSDDEVILVTEKGPVSSSTSLLQAPSTTMEEESGEEEKAMEGSKQEEEKENSGHEEEEEEEEDDCYLIDPTYCFRKLTISDLSDDDVILVAEKGQLALRDFPHPRHLCANFPFNSTAHASYCSKCFCYVCEVPAPCLQWDGTEGHCNVCTKENPQKPPL